MKKTGEDWNVSHHHFYDQNKKGETLMFTKKGRVSRGIFLLFLVFFIGMTGFSVSAEVIPGEAVYKKLTAAVSGEMESTLMVDLKEASSEIDWNDAVETQFVGNLRYVGDQAKTGPGLYLLRKLTGELMILHLPEDFQELTADSDSPYAGLQAAFESKMSFTVKTDEKTVDGQVFQFAQLILTPEQLLMDRLFKISIILMLFFVMVGMGMTLTTKDFALVFTKPRGIFIGQVLQFGLMPLMAMVLGHLLGFYEEYPFIFVGLILITAIPGGVTSNLMTYYAKGDLALSISLTSFSTVLSIIFTPLLLALYCANMPEITIPVKVVIQTIMVLVIVPLIVGMSVRGKWPKAAEKATPFFSALGIIALLVLIIAGVLNNLNIFVDTTRYGVKFYFTIFTITMLGMLFGLFISKALGINNYQTRAISLETGLRNSALAMTIALLIQDSMGDFFSSMFVTSGIFGLVMYLAGLISIYLFPRFLPVEPEAEDKEKEKVTA